MEDNINLDMVANLPEALKPHLARVGGMDNFGKLEKSIYDLAAEVYGYFKELVEYPAAELTIMDKDK